MQLTSRRYVNSEIGLFLILFAFSLIGDACFAQTAAVALKAGAALEGQEITWESIGPGGGGWIQLIVWDPIDGETLHVGGDVGRYYFSSDAGRHWKRLLDFRFVQTVAVSPADANVLYVVTNDHSYHDAYAAEGVLKSRDRGVTWKRQNSGLSHRGIHCISISPHNASVLYLGTGGNGAFIGKDLHP